ncbi:MAG: hypothetical protein ACRC92_26175 [Peptostreptococcaceae bacterium]
MAAMVMDSTTNKENLIQFLTLCSKFLGDKNKSAYEGAAMLNMLESLEKQFGVTPIGIGTNRKVYKFGAYVYKIPHRPDGRRDNLAELYISVYLTKKFPHLLKFIAITTQAIDPSGLIIEQEYITPLSSLVGENALEQGKVGMGVYRQLNSVAGDSLYRAMIRGLEEACIVIDMSKTHAPFNTGVKSIGGVTNYASLDYGYFFPHFGQRPSCPNHPQTILQYYIPERKDLDGLDDTKVQSFWYNLSEVTERYVDMQNAGCPFNPSSDNINSNTVAGRTSMDVRNSYGNIENIANVISQL